MSPNRKIVKFRETNLCLLELRALERKLKPELILFSKMTQPDIPAAADLQHLEIYSLENYLCADEFELMNFRCVAGCNHELRANQRRRWSDVSFFEFNEDSKLGEGGFGHVRIMNHNL